MIKRCRRGTVLLEEFEDRVICRHHKRVYVLTATDFTIICDCCHEPIVIPLPGVSALAGTVLATVGL